MFIPGIEEFKTLAKEYNLVPVYKELLADIETPVSTYLKLKDKGFSFLLESVERGERFGRYSFIGLNPLLIVFYEIPEIRIKQKEKEKKFLQVDDPLPILRQILSTFRLAKVAGLPRFQGGLVGYFSYDVVRCWERLPSISKKDTNIPEAIFVLPQELIIFDHVSHKMKIVNFVLIEEGKNAEFLYNEAKKRIESRIDCLASPLKYPTSLFILSEVKSNFTPSSFMEAVKKARDYIIAGDAIQVVLSQRLEVDFEGEDFSIYRALRSLNPSPYMFYLNFGELKLIGASPEILVRLEKGIITVRPIAGTRPRGKTEEEDKALEKELLADPKERAEHIMLVDLGRNDVGRVAKGGSVKVTELMVIERYSHVMHIVSNVIGELKKGEDAFTVLKATFPAGTVSGAPKVRAMEIIEELEPTKRGPYAGAVGYFSFSGEMDFCITIRTIVAWKNKLYIQVGAGIVADSIPQREYEETINKAKAMLKAIEWTKNGL
ncbi:MAG TPA: anthranilate synthase component I [Candidatus Desulfofervidus auxilii]|uniref:Anthranilate synthase component 1 n=1 Tax=Desulfofervidus auxilii TaxID=1621989 RepID=A0A7C0Y6U9_DESA2|nr:anthranilate synthase component I [Candidatus Desulfofervidus auxilii]